MKKLFSLLICTALLLSLGVSAFGDYEGEPQRCVELLLEANPSTGYSWQVASSDQEVAYIQLLSTVPLQEDSQVTGASCLETYRISGGQAGQATVTFSYCRPWESVQPQYAFTLAVTVDEGLNVSLGTQIALPRQEDSLWSFQTRNSDLVEVRSADGDQENQLFNLHPLAEGTAQLTFSRRTSQERLPGSLTYRMVTQGDSLSIYEIQFSLSAPMAFSFSATDLEGNPVDESIFAGRKLTLLSFWATWCPSCVAGMPALQKISQEYADRGVQVIGALAAPEAKEDVLEVVSATGVTYPILNFSLDLLFLQTDYVPTYVVLDETGNVLWGPKPGALSENGLRTLLDGLL